MSPVSNDNKVLHNIFLNFFFFGFSAGEEPVADEAETNAEPFGEWSSILVCVECCFFFNNIVI